MTLKSLIKVLLADDHPLITEGIGAVLNTFENIKVVGTATNGYDALEQAELKKPDVVLLDINMPKMNGLEAIEHFCKNFPQTKILMLSMHYNREYISSAMQKGASGYILKDVPSSEIATAIEAVYQGGTYFSSGISNILLETPATQTDDTLTNRELDILKQLASGQSNKQVARHLDISPRTVETHRKNIKRKLEIESTAGLTKYAIEKGLI